MTLENILYEVKDGIAWITFNRPNVLNALNQQTIDELGTIAKELAADRQVKAAILTGSGEKAFVAGADISELASMDPLAGKEFARKGQAVTLALENLSKPVIAAVNGYALGGGCEISLACHIRIASENAMFGQPEVNLGIIPGYGGTQRLTRLVGKGRALEIMLSGRMVSAQEALQIGLVNKVVPAGTLLDEAEKLVKVILSKGPLAIQYVLDAVNYGMNMALPEALEYEASLFGLVGQTEDRKEGAQAFLEKRPAKFQGR